MLFLGLLVVSGRAIELRPAREMVGRAPRVLCGRFIYGGGMAKATEEGLLP